jgi:hypothetical protein
MTPAHAQRRMEKTIAITFSIAFMAVYALVALRKAGSGDKR